MTIDMETSCKSYSAKPPVPPTDYECATRVDAQQTITELRGKLDTILFVLESPCATIEQANGVIECARVEVIGTLGRLGVNR